VICHVVQILAKLACGNLTRLFRVLIQVKVQVFFIPLKTCNCSLVLVDIELSELSSLWNTCVNHLRNMGLLSLVIIVSLKVKLNHLQAHCCHERCLSKLVKNILLIKLVLVKYSRQC